jgi:DNA mismatch repair protein MutS2
MDAFTLEKIEFDAVRRILSGYSSTSLGKSAALRIEPSERLDVVRRWLDDTSQMVEVVREHGLPPLAGVTDITEALARAVPGRGAGGEDFAAIAATLEGASACRNFLRDLPENLTSLHELAGGLEDFQPEVEAIRRIIGPDGAVRDDASPRLRKLRRDIADTTQQIHDVIHRYARLPEVKKLLQSPNVTLHGDRFVLPVRADNRGRLPGVVHRASHTGATVFVEPAASVELNNRLVNLHDHEQQEIEKLLTDLAVKVSARREAVEAALRTLTQVDLLSAKGQYAYQYDMTCPEVSDGGDLEFFQARHPLLEFVHRQAEREESPSNQVVPIDVRLGSDFDILILTGSNTGGKTVTLKTVALLAAMTQSGLHLPVRRGARMRVFHDVLIEIGDEQSLEQSLSTFGGHVERLKNIFRRARRDTLVLLDELGSGTDPDEGGAIGQAVLDELRRIGCLAMVTTHFSVLKAYALNHPRVDNASVEFDTQTLRPTYHLRIGTPGESHAITVAERLGLKPSIIESARRHLGTRGKQFRQALRRTGAARKQAESARADAAAAEFQAQQQTEALQAELADVERLKEQFADWLARLAELRPGDEIFVPSLGRPGRLARLETHRQIALVDLDNVQREIRLTELMPDLGQAKAREHLAALRRRADETASQAAADRVETQRRLDEAKRLEVYHKEQAKRFDAWLGAIARLKVGDEAPIAAKPGWGTVKNLDLPGLRVVVEAEGKEMTLSVQDLFPQTGPFAPGPQHPARPKRKSDETHTEPRPVPHRRPDSQAAKNTRQAVLAIPPGRKVYVIPFHSAATLVRFDEKKDIAVVSRGAFELEVPISDCEPVGFAE